MKLITMLCLMLGASNNGEELNLNFHQNDYKLKFERLEMVRYNKKIMHNFEMSTFKYNRTIAVANITFTPQVDLVDFETIIQVYKFMSNEYRFYPVHFAGNVCKFFAVNSGGIRDALSRCGNFVGCPFLKQTKYYACNVYPDASRFPPLIPNGEFKVEMQMLHASQEISLVAAYVTVSRPLV